jgi:large subunit ribosomal protein L22
VTGPKTNERPGVRAVHRYCQMSATKAREVLDLIRGEEVLHAAEILRFSERQAAQPVAKVLASAVANAVTNELLDPDELFVAACFADEGPTAKRFRPRARGRAGKIRKRTCHITVIVSRLPEDQLARRRRQAANQGSARARRVLGGRARRAGAEAGTPAPELALATPTQAQAETVGAAAGEAVAGAAPVFEAGAARPETVEAEGAARIEVDAESGAPEGDGVAEDANAGASDGRSGEESED